MTNSSDSGVKQAIPVRILLFHHPITVLGTLTLIVGFVQFWLNTAGTLRTWPKSTVYYPALTDAFLHGQISLRNKPAPELLALPDPYDPLAGRGHRWHDVSLYGAKYYLYWGPVPALAAAAVCLAMRIDKPYYYDQQLVFAFMLGTSFLAMVLMLQARAKLFPQFSPWIIFPPALSLGLGAPALILDGVYGAAIAGGQFFMIAGVCAAWQGLLSSRARWVWMAVASTCWTLSGGSRVSLPPALAVMAALTLWQIWRQKSDRSPWPSAAALFIPIIAGAALYAWYNFARFHSIFEFGQKYQLASTNQHGNPTSDYFSPRYVVINVYRYFLATPVVRKTFPFFSSSTHHPWFSPFFKLPPFFSDDPLVGIIWVQPLLFLAPLAAARRALGRWLFVSLAAGAVLGFIPALSANGSNWRYLMDFVPGCTILAALGYARLVEVSGRRRRWIEVAAILLVLCQSAVAVLLTLDSRQQSFQQANPGLYDAIASFFNHL